MSSLVLPQSRVPHLRVMCLTNVRVSRHHRKNYFKAGSGGSGSSGARLRALLESAWTSALQGLICLLRQAANFGGGHAQPAPNPFAELQNPIAITPNPPAFANRPA